MSLKNSPEEYAICSEMNDMSACNGDDIEDLAHVVFIP
jgi:hypothetical protein